MYPRQSNFRSAEPRSAWFSVFQYDGTVTRRFVIETEGFHAITSCQQALNEMLADCGPALRGQTLRTGPGGIRLHQNRQVVIPAPERLELNGVIAADFVAATMFENCIGGTIGPDERSLVESLFSHDTYSPLFTALYYWLWKDHDLRASMSRLSDQPVFDGLGVTRPYLTANTILPEWGHAPPVPEQHMAPQVRYVGIEDEPRPHGRIRLSAFPTFFGVRIG
jgi:hypothetical protein